MKKLSFITIISIITISIGYGFGFAMWLDDDHTIKLSGKHFQFNIIGHPKNVDVLPDGADNSNGRAIMVPLKNSNKAAPLTLECDDDPDGPPITVVDDTMATPYELDVDKRAKIYFTPGDHYGIVDRDATDKDGAEIVVDTNEEANPLCEDYAAGECPYPETQQVRAFDIYLRVLGKPYTCMNINGFAYDRNQDLYFWSGRVELNRKTGKSTFVPVNELFDVYWSGTLCYDDNGEEVCDTFTDEVLSVFNDVFESYFWDILNNGTRLVQVRLYPVTQ